jgi:hypothetical protein
MSDEQTDKLVDLALNVLEDELSCWKRIGLNVSKMTRLVRYPPMPPEFPMTDASIEEAGNQTFEILDVPDSEVNGVLTRFAMKKVVEAISKEILI